MVLLTVTSAAESAIQAFLGTRQDDATQDDQVLPSDTDLAALKLGSPIEHSILITISQALVQRSKQHKGSSVDDRHLWRLDTLLKGASLYRPPPVVKPAPSPEFVALMQVLRKQEEQRQYERLLHSNPNNLGSSSVDHFVPALSHGDAQQDDTDELTYADVNRQVILIINVLVSIVACSIAIWIGARSWSVPNRLGLSMTGSIVVGLAEVAIYTGYLRRIKEAKEVETKKVETKKILETWTIEQTENKKFASSSNALRSRKAKA